MDISEKIENLREQKRISKRELSFKLGLDNQNYNRLISRKNKLSLEQIQKFAEALGVSLSFLLFGNQEENSAKEQLQIRILDLEKIIKYQEKVINLLETNKL
jgi:transcriptional regulator with XRE-family HTH domain